MHDGSVVSGPGLDLALVSGGNLKVTVIRQENAYSKRSVRRCSCFVVAALVAAVVVNLFRKDMDVR